MTHVTYKSNTVVMQAHERVHSGAGYTATSVVEDMPKKSAHNILMHCGNKPIHLFEYDCRSDGGDSKIELFEDPHIISEGLEFPYKANNRTIRVATGARLTEFAEIGDDSGVMLSVVPSYKLSHPFARCQEFILRSNKVYLLRSSNPLGKKVELTTRIFFYVLD